jgi:hypothetical protein
MSNWIERNQSYLVQAIARVRQALERQSKPAETEPDIAPPPLPTQEDLPAVAQLCQIFNLSPFARDVLLLCAGMEFDSGWGALCAAACGDAQKAYPTLSLALAIFPNAHWEALTPTAPLRQWRLVEIGAGTALTTSPLRIDERILHYLAGIQHLDERLSGMVQPVPQLEQLVPSHQQLVDRLVATWQQASSVPLPAVQLCGADTVSKGAIASTACTQMGINLQAIAAEALPTDASQLNLVKCLWEREWVLNRTALLLDCETGEGGEAIRESAIARWIDSLQSPLIIISRDRRRQRQRPLVTFEVRHPTANEQQGIWHGALGEGAAHLNGQVETLVSHFNLSAPAIHAACLQVTHLDSHSSIPDRLWDICRTQARPRLDELAQRIDSTASWEDFVLPEQERCVLQEIAAHVRQRRKVYEYWGFAGKSQRGLGISALFAGASGTGKTMAAEVLGSELQVDVYRIDLSAIVSKYIGETEKNLRRVFDAAEGSGVILLFDEADALFGKRSEVKDSHDRHANIEVSYLLQRMEAYRGLAILTTNLKGSIDQAFLRRIRFMVQFPFPDISQREEIWQRIFPKQTPIGALNFKKLAKLNVAGGNIRNIALNAAFLAADAGESVQMKHILQAAKNEYVKMERPLTDVEVKGWV